MCISACTSGSRDDLAEVVSSRIEVSASKPGELSHAVQPGVYLVEIREREIDVRVLVESAGLRAELEDRVPRHGTIYRVIDVAAPTTLRLEVRSTDHRTKLGGADVRLARFTRARDAQPGELERGFEAEGAAGELIAQAKPETWARAADKLYEAISHFEAARDDGERARAAYALANLQYGARDEWTATVRATEVARDAFGAIDDEVGLRNADAVRAAAEIELAAGMNADTQRAEQQALYQSADRRLASAADYFEKHALPVRAQYAVNMRAVGAVNTGDYATAEKMLSRSVEMARANRDVAEEARSLGNLAAIHTFRGQIAQAAREFAALQPLVDRETQPYEYAALLGNYGFNLIALGDFDRALALQTEALDGYTKVGDEDERAAALAAIGSLYFRMGDAERALETLRAASVAQERVGDTLGRASTLRVAGNAASALGQHAAALKYLRESARIDSNPHGVARTSVLIAGELRTTGDLAGAESALAKPIASENALVRSSALEERARVRLARRQTAAAIEDLRAADAQYAQLGLEFNRIDTHTELAEALLATGDVSAASVAADEAIAIVSRIRVKSGNPEWRARFLSARYSPYEARIAVDLASGKEGDTAAAWRAFRTAEQVRAQSLADEMAVAPTDAARGADPEDAVLRARLTSQQMRLESRVQRQDADESGILALRRAIEETRAQIDLNRLRHSSVIAQQKSVGESLAQVQQKLPADSAVLAYFVGDERGHAWLLTRTALRHLALPPRAALERAVVTAIRNHRVGKPGGADRELGNLLLGKLLAGVTEKRVLVLADGPLNSVPFAALPIPGDDGLIVDRFVLGYAPSLALAVDATRGNAGQHHRVAVVSDPVYASDDQRLRLAGGPGGTLRSAGPPETNNFTRLPYSALEASAVTKAFGTDGTIQLSGFAATTQRVLELPSKELAVLHFATHAQARRDFPEQSALYLSEYAPDGSRLAANQLTANDIRRTGLRADVVVLSGCATGDGSELRGEGVLGLTYGFLANGSHSVVAALWPIEDSSTARFMNEFYTAYRETRRAADALRTAQLRSRANTASAVWSSFVVRANEFP